MKDLFKFKKCNKTTKWVVYSKEFFDKMLNSHPMASPVLINSHIDFLNSYQELEYKHHYEQQCVMDEILLPKINEINKGKNWKQLYADRLVNYKGIFDVALSSHLDERLEFLDWYYNLIFPLKSEKPEKPTFPENTLVPVRYT